MFRRSGALERIFVAVCLLVLVYQLFIGGTIGLANSGDFSRIMNWVGIHYASNDPVQQRFFFVHRLFEWTPKLELHYPSSEVFLVAAALPVSLIMHRHVVFDIRALGIVHMLCYLFVLALLTRFTRTLRFRNRILIYILAIFIFLDVGFVAYFNSFYSEPASLLFLAAAVAFALVGAANDPTRKHAYLPFVGFLVSLILFASAKTQNAVSAIPLAFLAYGLLPTVFRERLKPSRRRLVSISLAVVLSLSFIAYYKAATVLSRSVHKDAVYLNVFNQILGRSSTPAEDARELGLDPSLAIYAGTDVITPGVPPQLVDSLPRMVTYDKILKFYAKHPDRFLEMSEDAAQRAFNTRPPYLGNYEESHFAPQGAPPATPNYPLPSAYFDHKFSLWSTFKEDALPSSLTVVLVYLTLNLVAIAVKHMRFDRTSENRIVTRLHAALIATAIVQFLTTVIGVGMCDIEKHLFLFNLICEICLVFLIVYVANIGGIVRKRGVELG